MDDAVPALIDAEMAPKEFRIGALQIKLGSPVSGEQSAKYNRLLEIEQELAVET